MEITSKNYAIKDMKWHDDSFGSFFTFTFYKKDDPENLSHKGVATSYFDIENGIRIPKEEQIRIIEQYGWTHHGFPISNYNNVIGLYEVITKHPHMGTVRREPQKAMELPEFVKTPDEPSVEEIAALNEKVLPALANI